MIKTTSIGAIALMAAISVASGTRTIATFSDPATSASTPLFTFNSLTNTLNGAWLSDGLTLRTPGFVGGGETPNVRFQMSQLNLTPVLPGTMYSTGQGTVTFYTSSITNPIFVIDFSNATLVNPFSFGANETVQLLAQNVTFSGPNVPTGLFQESFTFSFANTVQSGNTITYTAAFTSSAVPEPMTMTALGLGLAAVAARRRRK